MGWIAVHRKAILGALAALGGICSVIAVHAEWGQIAQWAGIAVAVLSAAGVYRVPNAAPAAEKTPGLAVKP
jgi:hypothetical protein